MQDMISFSFFIYSLATSFFILGNSLFNAMDTILVIGLRMALAYAPYSNTIIFYFYEL
jgi:hypothetical protein